MDARQDMPTPHPVQHFDVVTPLFYGTSDMLTWRSGALLDSVDRTSLYRRYWCRSGRSEVDFERLVLTDFEPAFEALTGQFLQVDARGYYGIWPVYVHGETVCLLGSSDFTTEIARFTFPRVLSTAGRSVADWLRPEGDIIVLQATTLGTALVRHRTEYLENGDEHGLGTYLDGFGRFLAELLADKVTAEVRRAMHIADRTWGTRYRFGNPGTPRLGEQGVLLDLLCAEDRLGLSMTSLYQVVPDYSAVEIFIHHKESRPLQPFPGK
jgi:5-methyltetrahydrofolate--homocysteine methyltransferase